jgi:hypothetical protein
VIFRWAATGKQPNQFAKNFFMFIVEGTILSVLHWEEEKLFMAKVQ